MYPACLWNGLVPGPDGFRALPPNQLVGFLQPAPARVFEVPVLPNLPSSDFSSRNPPNKFFSKLYLKQNSYFLTLSGSERLVMRKHGPNPSCIFIGQRNNGSVFSTPID